MVKDQASSVPQMRPLIKANWQSVPWKPAALIAALLFVAETHMPSAVIEANPGNVANQMQGSAVRQVCYLTIGILGVVYLVRLRNYRIRWRSPVTLTFGSLVVWCVLSVTWADEPATSFKRVIAYLLMITGAAGASAAWSNRQILRFISLTGAFQLTAGIVAEIVTGYFKPWVSGYRFAGTQPWNLEGFCCLVFVLSSVAAADADPPRKVFFRCLALYGLTFLVLTRARGSMMGATVGFLVYLLLSRSVLTKVSIGLAASISGLLLYMSGLFDTLIDFLSRGGEGTTTLTGRQPLWDLLWTFVPGRPLTGYGYHDFFTQARVDYFESELHWEQIDNAHNIYLDNILTLGYIGLLLHTSVLLLGVVCGSYYFRKTRSPIFALAAAVSAAFLLVGCLETVVFISPGPVAFGVTMLLWVLCLERKTNCFDDSVGQNAL
jgi:exopolysaccharide production protein ExoQ